jgi:hypothetical protein
MLAEPNPRVQETTPQGKNKIIIPGSPTPTGLTLCHRGELGRNVEIFLRVG